MLCLNLLLLVTDAADVPTIAAHLTQAMRGSRSEPGCLRYDVYHSQAEPKRFVLVEHWADQAALDAHRLAAAYTTIYKPLVLPLIDREGHPATLLGEGDPPAGARS